MLVGEICGGGEADEDKSSQAELNRMPWNWEECNEIKLHILHNVLTVHDNFNGVLGAHLIGRRIPKIEINIHFHYRLYFILFQTYFTRFVGGSNLSRADGFQERQSSWILDLYSAKHRHTHTYISRLIFIQSLLNWCFLHHHNEIV